ncbi:MAG TPA: glycosyltransferase [Gemmatimonadaceae bacterium]|nr:glycosyltransferase [Gemmatimonadaceae bacterium]
MKILVVTHNYPRFADDPAGAFVKRLAIGAVDAGHQVTVIAPHARGQPTWADEDGVRVHRFRYAPDALERVAYRGDLHATGILSALAMVGIPVFLLAFAVAIRRVSHAWRPDVVHAHWWFPGGWLASSLGVPLVITTHGSDIRLLDRSSVLRRLATHVMNRARLVTTVSDFLARNVRSALPALRTPVARLSMPLDVAHFERGREEAKSDPPLILYAGNLLASKGVTDLIDAFALLRQQGVQCRLKVLGEGPERAALERHARAVGVAEAVQFADFVGQDTMPAEYGAATVTVLPTRGDAEGLGLSLAEASLAGSAIVGTPAGGIPEVVVDEATGLIARSGDAADLARQIARLLEAPDLRTGLTARAAAMSREQFAPANAVDRFLRVYRDAAADRD